MTASRVLYSRMPVAPFRHTKIMRDAQVAGVTVEDLARARASFEGGDILAAFDADQARGEMTRGTFVEHVVWIERLIMRATDYARQRSKR